MSQGDSNYACQVILAVALPTATIDPWHEYSQQRELVAVSEERKEVEMCHRRPKTQATDTIYLNMESTPWDDPR